VVWAKAFERLATYCSKAATLYLVATNSASNYWHVAVSSAILALAAAKS